MAARFDAVSRAGLCMYEELAVGESQLGPQRDSKEAPVERGSDATSDFTDPSIAERLVAVLDQYLEDLKAARAVSRDELLARHPDLHERLEACLAGIEFLHQAEQAVASRSGHGAESNIARFGSTGSGPATGTDSDGRFSADTRIGDFRLLREIGRGGMGAVFEADQISLGRRVALKILRFGPVSDEEAVGRFRREAETVAKLHHTNIVPIFAIGSEHGVNFYAMQFIEGRSLDRVLKEAQRERAGVMDVSDAAKLAAASTAVEQNGGATGSRVIGASNEPRTSTPTALDPQAVAGWGLQAAEALAHAHARHVIHRDVKPSNLILDDEGRIWLTDFGLAKRLDDVTMSMTGALLGTPRYMSPEQADAARRRVDHRTDLYSLGATLFELATGRPVFTAESPHAVIGQILADEPPPPRTIRPSIPRDLDTIILKCLAKEPSGRYGSAKELADDLRAFLDGRSIRARRPSIVEAAVKSIRRQRRSVALTMGTAAATILVAAFGIASWLGYKSSQIARIDVKTDTPPLIAEWLDDAGQRIAGPITLPTQQPIDLPSGEWRMRVSGEGQLSRTFAISLTPGEFRHADVNLADRRLGPTVRYDHAMRLVRFANAPAKADGDAEPPAAVAEGSPADSNAGAISHRSTTVSAVLFGLNDLQRQELSGMGTTKVMRSTMRSIEADGTHHPDWAKDSPGYEWCMPRVAGAQGGFDKFDLRPFVVGQVDEDPSRYWPDAGADSSPVAPDLDGDGMGDLVIAAQHQAWILALSGETLATIWFAPRGEDLSQGVPGGISYGVSNVASAALASPIVAGDVNGDGAADLLALFGDVGTSPRTAGTETVRRWAELISGRDGSTIWRRDLPDEWFSLPAGGEIPYAMRWFMGGYSGMTSMSSSGQGHFRGIVSRRLSVDNSRSGRHVYAPDAPHIDGDRVRLLAGTRVVSLELASGKIEWSGDLSLVPGMPAQWSDIDGDGELDALLLEDLGFQVTKAGLRNLPHVRIAVWSPARRELLWSHNVVALWPRRPAWQVEPPRWPLVADLDGDGVAEILAPDGTSEGAAGWNSKPWGDLVLLDGRTGKPRWSRRILNMDQTIDRVAVGPDVDGDGVRDVFAASLWGESFDLFIDALSGADGEPIWRMQHTLRKPRMDASEFLLGPMTWWSSGDDGWPQLVASAFYGQTTFVCVSAGTGRISHILRDAGDVASPDIDGDGFDDLAVSRTGSYVARDQGGELNVYRGMGNAAAGGGEFWRRIAQPAAIVGDLNGDGVRDVLAESTSPGLDAFSGIDGSLLWRASGLPREAWRQQVVGGGTSPASPSDAGRLLSRGFEASDEDLNGDGYSDVVLCATRDMGRSFQPLNAISGRTGKRLWSAAIEVRNMTAVLALDVRDLDGDDAAEVILLTAADWGYGRRSTFGSFDQQLWLAVFSGRSGQLKWKHPLSKAHAGNTSPPHQFGNCIVEITYGDLNGDGTIDLVVPAETDPAMFGTTSGGAGGNTPGDATLEVRALSGVDGSRLWRIPLPASSSPNEAFAVFQPSVVSDLNGDGRNELTLFTIESGISAQGMQRRTARIETIEGRTGTGLWNWKANVDPDFGRTVLNSAEIRSRPRLTLLRSQDGNRRIAALLRFDDRRTSIAVLNHDGDLLEEIPVGSPQDFFADRQRIWTCDADGDGGDELVFRREVQNSAGTYESRLAAVDSTEPDKPRWSFLLSGQEDRVVGVLPAPSGAKPPAVVSPSDSGARGRSPSSAKLAPTIAVRIRANRNLQGIDNGPHLVGLDAASGLLRWSCAAPQPSDKSGTQVYVVAEGLLTGGESGPPLVFHQFADVLIGSEAREWTDVVAGNLASTQMTPRRLHTSAVAAARASESDIDPRLIRALPWSLTRAELITRAREFAWIGFYSLTLVVIPGLFVGRLIWYRRFGMKTLLAAPVVVLLAVMGATFVGADNAMRGLTQRLAAGLFFAPLLLSAGLLVRWAFARRWKTIVFWLAMSVVTAIVLGAFSLLVIEPRQAGEWLPGERYSLSGWSHIWFPAAMLTSVLMLIVAAMVGVYRVLRRSYARRSTARRNLSATNA